MSVIPSDDAASARESPDTGSARESPVLIVDDDELFLSLFSRQLARRGLTVEPSSRLEDALDVQSRLRPAVIIADHDMPDTSAVRTITRFREADPTASLVVLSGHIDVRDTVLALRAGADDVLTKPPDLELVLSAIERGVRRATLARRERMTAPLAGDVYGLLDGSGPAQRLVRQVEQLAMRDLLVLIVGEAGTGRRAVAELLHHLSLQASGPFTSIAMNRRQDRELVEALASAQVALEAPDTAAGTWFFDDVGLMRPDVQRQLLRTVEAIAHVQHRGQMPHRLVACTQRDLAADVRHQRLDASLLPRLGAVTLAVPSLRERGPSAIVSLATRVLERRRIELGSGPSRLSSDACAMLGALAWPGNFPQLRSVIEEAAVRAADADRLAVEHLMPALRPVEPSDVETSQSTDWSLRGMERRHIAAVLRFTNGHRSRAAQLLGIARATLYNKLADLGLDDAPE